MSRVLFLSTLMACGVTEQPVDDTDVPVIDVPPPAVEAPGDPGPYGVGVQTHTFARVDGDDLTVEIWYPATVTDDDPREVYDPVFLLQAHAVRDAPADAREALPLVVFSHGFGGVRYQSAFLTEHLAAHGFVVVAPDHPRNHLFDLHSDEASVVAARRPSDVSDVIDWMIAEGAADIGLDDHLDATNIGVVGHSFGAFTALSVGGGLLDAAQFETWCATEGGRACNFFEGQVLDPALVAAKAQPDRRVSAIVALAPGGWYGFGVDGVGLNDVVAPLIMAGTLDSELPYDTEARPTWERLGSGARLVTLENAGHWAFSDLCILLPVADCAGEDKGYMAHDRVHGRTRAFTTAHLQAVLRGRNMQTWLEEEADDVMVELVP